MFKYEMHLHSCQTSRCGVSESTDYIAAAKKRGFSGMVFTNHFFRGNTAIDRELPWRDFVNAYAEEFYKAGELAKGTGIDVLFGLEEGYGNGKECLIYGLRPETIAECNDFSRLPIKELSVFVRENGGFIACAHPFRVRGYITDSREEPNPELFDAVEVYNRGNSLEDNILAEEYAVKYSLPAICGGDTHRDSDFGYCGVAFEERVSDSKTLVRLLKSRKYSLIADKEKGNAGNLFKYI